jgi:glucoamylase
LTGERGHYELAAGRDVRPFLRTMEAFASRAKLLPEQVWADADRPGDHMYFGRPTGAAMPLLWAHAEYIKLVRSATDGTVFDLIPEVAERYRRSAKRTELEIWKFNRQAASVKPGGTLRIQAAAPFRLRWTNDEWQKTTDTRSTATGLGPEFVDISVPRGQQAPLRFTFFWTTPERWEGRDFAVAIR